MEFSVDVLYKLIKEEARRINHEPLPLRPLYKHYIHKRIHIASLIKRFVKKYPKLERIVKRLYRRAVCIR